MRDLGEQSAGEYVREVGVFECSLGFEDGCEGDGGFDPDGVAFEVDFFDVGAFLQWLGVFVEIGGGVEFERLATEGKNSGHCEVGISMNEW